MASPRARHAARYSSISRSSRFWPGPPAALASATTLCLLRPRLGLVEPVSQQRRAVESRSFAAPDYCRSGAVSSMLKPRSGPLKPPDLNSKGADGVANGIRTHDPQIHNLVL